MPHTLLRRLVMSLGCLSGFAAASLAQAAPLGDPVMVNTATAGNQRPVYFSAGSNGEKLLIWSDAAANATYAQRIRSSGTPYLTKHLIQAPPAYANFSVDRIGNFVFGSDPGRVTAYDRSGTLLSSFQTTPDSSSTVASMDTDGNITAAYSRSASQGAPRTIAIRRFNTRGVAIGPEVIVASDAPDRLSGPSSIATDDAGNIALSFATRPGPTANQSNIMIQRFSRAGVALTPALVVGAVRSIYSSGGRIAMDPGGRSVISWSASQDDNYTWNIYARAYDANGNPGSGVVRVNQRIHEGQPGPNPGVAENGDFVVSWIASSGVVGGPQSSTLAARQFRSDGTPIADEFRVDPPQPQFGANPLLAMDPVGNFAVAWVSTSAGTGWDVMVRSFKMDTRPPLVQLLDNQAVQGLAGGTDSWSYYRITVPPGVAQLNVNMTGPVGGGDGDMYVRLGALPSLTAWDYRPYVNGSNEAIAISNPLPGDFYIAIHGRSAYSSVGLTASYD